MLAMFEFKIDSLDTYFNYTNDLNIHLFEQNITTNLLINKNQALFGTKSVDLARYNSYNCFDNGSCFILDA